MAWARDERFKAKPARMAWRMRQRLRPWAADRSGATAVEFGLLALPFFLIVLAILETSLVFLGEITLQRGVATVSRDIRVGTIRAGQAELFDKHLCDTVGFLMTCSKLRYDVRSYSTFAAIPPSTAGDNGSFDSSGFRFAPGGSGAINVVRVYYEWPLVTDFFRKSLAGLDNGHYLMAATTAFRGERF